MRYAAKKARPRVRVGPAKAQPPTTTTTATTTSTAMATAHSKSWIFKKSFSVPDVLPLNALTLMGYLSELGVFSCETTKKWRRFTPHQEKTFGRKKNHIF